jgi:hypothetical protein
MVRHESSPDVETLAEPSDPARFGLIPALAGGNRRGTETNVLVPVFEGDAPGRFAKTRHRIQTPVGAQRSGH